MTTPRSALSFGSVWDVPRFPSVDACMAIGCNTQWLTGLISASPVVYPLGRDEVVERVKRRMFLFKFRTVFHLALMRAISSVLPLAVARDLSRVCVEAENLFPADLAPDGCPRYLVIAPVSKVSKMFVREAGEPGLTFEDLASVGDDPAEPRIVLDVTAIFDQVVEGLDLLEVAGELIG
ncbi:MAG: hypothetical protein IM653_07835 [Phenylobacterium sp.]|uniref:hypothetical protein n=1 Tax=Phenylobacterium sp. TaxID=1871053 RepID=UPI0025EB190F|nr:hypothetical protein [Phenylobacterium sp.]MCA6227324.1 hypothetical protein [Phenylobacterium sp.]MCA6231361.1 hypothetical protein [Phenylobacterium sp.]MCA6235032.1 hypothetical protein [Phenylobacterium sp.]MCA6249415.1 hypothetical protein [Phenylobacterium sp.]MCA6250910.1 hypothetical protein [Phenylobacterium sp.]